MHKSRLNQRFENQIDKDFQPVQRGILLGSIKDIYNIDKRNFTRKNLKIAKVTKRSKMKEIIGWGSRRRKPPRFQGAIVAETDDDGTRYFGVPEGRFMRHELFYAKHGSYDTAKLIPAYKKTGVVDDRVIISWESKPGEYALVHKKRTLDHLTVQQNSRSVARPDRFELGTSGRMVGKSTPLPPKSTSLHYENALRYYAFFRSIKFTRNEGYYAISQLICFGDLHWARYKVEERKLETKVHKLKMKLH